MGEKRAAFKSTPGFRVSRVRRRCELMHRHPRAIDSALAPSVIYLTSNFRGVQDRRKIIWLEKTLTVCCSILRGNASYGWGQAVFRTQKVTTLGVLKNRTIFEIFRTSIFLRSISHGTLKRFRRIFLLVRPYLATRSNGEPGRDSVWNMRLTWL